MLFTAPAAFLKDSIHHYIARCHIRFCEAWERGEVPSGVEAAYWIPNPGQHFVIDAELLRAIRGLRAICTPSTGTNHIDMAACRAAGVAVTSLLDDRQRLETIAASAEFTFLHVLNGLRRIDLAIAAVSRGEWREDEARLRGRELQGCAVGLVGAGRVGRRLARYFRAFRCHPICFYDPYSIALPRTAAVQSLSDLFRASRVVVVCCALTEETDGMIGGEHLELMPPGGIFVNTSRGEVLREGEIAEVLARRADLVACVDVVTGEVEGSHLRSPLLSSHKNGRALVTPHIAGATVESQVAAAVSALAMIERLESQRAGR